MIQPRLLQNKCCLINTVNRIRLAFRTLTARLLYKFGLPGDKCCLINTVNSKCKQRVPCAYDCLSTSAFRNYTSYFMTVARHMRYSESPLSIVLGFSENLGQTHALPPGELICHTCRELCKDSGSDAPPTKTLQNNYKTIKDNYKTIIRQL